MAKRRLMAKRGDAGLRDLALFSTSTLRPTPNCRPRGTYPHLSYSIAPPSSVSAFVAHDPTRTFVCVYDCGNYHIHP